MFTIASSAISLFFQGRLFANPAKAYWKLLLGVFLTATIFVIATVACDFSWPAALIAGFFGGMLQPYFCKNLRYR